MFQIKSYPRVIRLSIALMIFLLAGLQYKVWFGQSGFFERQIVVVELEKKRNSLEDLRATNRTLRSQISSLKENVNSYERLARSELGMIKKGELYIYAERPFDPSEKN